jgi:hypothetical protein
MTTEANTTITKMHRLYRKYSTMQAVAFEALLVS